MLTGTPDERRVRRADVEQDKSFPGEHLFLLHRTIPPHPLIAGPNNLPFESARETAQHKEGHQRERERGRK